MARNKHEAVSRKRMEMNKAHKLQSSEASKDKKKKRKYHPYVHALRKIRREQKRTRGISKVGIKRILKRALAQAAPNRPLMIQKRCVKMFGEALHATLHQVLTNANDWVLSDRLVAYEHKDKKEHTGYPEIPRVHSKEFAMALRHLSRDTPLAIYDEYLRLLEKTHDRNILEAYDTHRHAAATATQADEQFAQSVADEISL